MTGDQFTLPTGVNVVTLTADGEPVVFNAVFDNEINNFYSQGKYIFENQDKSNTFTQEGHMLQTKLQKISKNIEIRNHTSGQMNDMLLQLVGPNCSSVSCSIDCHGLSHAPYAGKSVSNCNIIDKSKGTIVSPLKISDVIRIEHNTHDFIVIACRKTDENLGMEKLSLLRDTSVGHSTLDPYK